MRALSIQQFAFFSTCRTRRFFARWFTAYYASKTAYAVGRVVQKRLYSTKGDVFRLWSCLARWKRSLLTMRMQRAICAVAFRRWRRLYELFLVQRHIFAQGHTIGDFSANKTDVVTATANISGMEMMNNDENHSNGSEMSSWSLPPKDNILLATVTAHNTRRLQLPAATLLEENQKLRLRASIAAVSIEGSFQTQQSSPPVSSLSITKKGEHSDGESVNNSRALRHVTELNISDMSASRSTLYHNSDRVRRSVGMDPIVRHRGNYGDQSGQSSNVNGSSNENGSSIAARSSSSSVGNSTSRMLWGSFTTESKDSYDVHRRTYSGRYQRRVDMMDAAVSRAAALTSDERSQS
jgi:hypothetical protein